MENLKHKLWEGITSVAGKISGPMKESKFYSEGKLTPEEYIAAGDFLTQKCPTWKWCQAKEGFQNKNLPADKQYLKTTVPCSSRANDYMKQNATTEKIVEGDWVEAELVTENKAENKIVDLDDDDENKNVVVANKPAANTADDDDDDDFIVRDDDKKDNNNGNNNNGKDNNEKKEIDDFLVVDDEDKNNDNNKDKNKIEGSTIKTRTYDVMVTYDFYYCVPRMWLMGYNENGQPLSDDEMKEDIMEEYRNKTVTIENQPCTGMRNVSVHPCRHSLLLKKMIDNFEKSGKKLDVTMSILIFLKFLHSVVPTIQYDFTMDINF